MNYLETPGNAGEHLQDTKDANGLDWYVEGPGRRVGYDDLTAIDWIFEYAKERQRLRYLYSSASGILGHLKQLVDASQVWIILVAAGILSGGIAAFIDVASDWLGDLKTGYCSNVDGDGRFYLNKSFCCWGYTELSQCHDWHPWGNALGIGAFGGRWVVEYVFFVLFSVGRTQYLDPACLTSADILCCMCKPSRSRVLTLCKTERYSRDQDGVGRICYTPLFGWLDFGHKDHWFGKRQSSVDSNMKLMAYSV